MYLNVDTARAETAYRQERIKREFGRATARRERRERASQSETRHARRVFRPTPAA